MNKTSDYVIKTALKMILTVLMAVMITSCSKEIIGGNLNGGPIIDKGFSLTLQPLPFYSTNPFIRVFPNILSENDDRTLESLELWSNDSGCSGAIDGFSDRVSFISLGAQVSLDLNQENLISYKVVFSDGSKSTCTPISSVTHDDIAPVGVTISSGPIKTNLNSIYFSITGIASDVKDLSFFYNGNIATPDQVVSAILWGNNQGFINIPQNQINSVTVKAVDNAGNESVMSAPISITHKNTLPNSPILDSSVTSMNGEVTGAPSFTLLGTLAPDVVEVKVYKDSTALPALYTLTPAEFTSGHSVALIDGGVNNFLITAVDDFGNVSPSVSLVILSTQTPVYSYNLAVNELSSNKVGVPGASVPLRVEIINSSLETTLNAPVNASSVLISESSPNMIIDQTKGCPVSGILAASSCEIFITINYATIGSKVENMTISLNGTVIPVTVEFEIVDPVISIISPANLATLGPFVKLDPAKNFIIFSNGVLKVSDLSTPILNPVLTSDLSNTEASWNELSLGIKSGKAYYVDKEGTYKELVSTRNYNPGDIRGASNLLLESGLSKLVVEVENSTLSSDLLVEDVGELLDKTVDSNITSGASLYYRSGPSIHTVSTTLIDSIVPGIIAIGDIAQYGDIIHLLGDSGGGNSIHKIESGVLSSIGLLAGANLFNQLNEGYFAYQIGANFGGYFQGSIFSNANVLVTEADLKMRPTDPDQEESAGNFKISTAGGPKTVVSKYDLFEQSIFKTELDRGVFGEKVSNPYATKDGDFFIFNRATGVPANPESVVVSILSSDYSSISEDQVIVTPYFDESFINNERMVFTNSVSLKSVINVIDFEDGLAQTTLSYLSLPDIADNQLISFIKVGPNDYLVYYQNTLASYSFKVVRIY